MGLVITGYFLFKKGNHTLSDFGSYTTDQGRRTSAMAPMRSSFKREIAVHFTVVVGALARRRHTAV
jgi:hypothetical protein